MDTLHCALENGADLYVNEHQKMRHYRARSAKERRKEEEEGEEGEAEEERMPNRFARCACKLAQYSDVIPHSIAIQQ